MAIVEGISLRHEGHQHYINVKYGHIIFGISLLYIIVLVTTRRFYDLNWNRTSHNLKTTLLSPFYLSLAFWVAIIASIGFYHILLPHDYVSLAKRMGRIAYVLVPLDIFLASRPNIFYVPHLQLIDLHKWVSRLIVLCAALHGTGYFIKWIIEGALLKAFRLWNMLGIIVALCFLILIIVSLKSLRRTFYCYFYLIHNVTVVLFVVLISIHARPGVLAYTFVSGAMLLLQAYSRLANSFKVSNFEIFEDDNSTLIMVRIPRNDFPLFSCGSHLRLTYPLNNPKSWMFPTHPYTIASVTQDDTIDLIVRKTKNFQFDTKLEYCMTGPFDALSVQFLAHAEDITIICGGSGISLGLPVLRAMKEAKTIDLIWCVRDKSDLHILKNFNSYEKIKVFITGVGNSSDIFAFDEEDYGLLHSASIDELELGSLAPKEVDDISLVQEKPKKGSSLNVTRGRPDLKSLIRPNPNTETKGTQRWLLACGPEALVNESRKLAYAAKLKFASEIYDM